MRDEVARLSPTDAAAGEPAVLRRLLQRDLCYEAYDVPQEEVLRDLQWRCGVAAARGIRNLGDTCFVNAVAQVLLRVAPIRRVLEAHRRRRCPFGNACPVCALAAQAAALAVQGQGVLRGRRLPRPRARGCSRMTISCTGSATRLSFSVSPSGSSAGPRFRPASPMARTGTGRPCSSISLGYPCGSGGIARFARVFRTAVCSTTCIRCTRSRCAPARTPCICRTCFGGRFKTSSAMQRGVRGFRTSAMQTGQR